MVRGNGLSGFQEIELERVNFAGQTEVTLSINVSTIATQASALINAGTGNVLSTITLAITGNRGTDYVSVAADSSNLESYRLIAIAYERLGDNDRALRFWRLFEVIYEIAPETIPNWEATPDREAMHEEALLHIEILGGTIAGE